jgi:cytochrome c2
MSRVTAGRVVGGALLALGLASACSTEREDPAPLVPGGEPARGVAAIRRHGCGGCHVIPGLPESRGRVGPSLAGFASRPYIAGALPNHPLELIEWIRNPRATHPETIMPGLGVTMAEARDIAAHLYRLR